MSRSAVMLIACAENVLPRLRDQLARDPFGVGIYCAIDTGPLDHEGARKLSQARDDEFSDVYSRFYPPKQLLRSSTGLAASNLGIHLGLMGPVNTYHHPRLAPLHAAMQAEFDLEQGTVTMALLCSAFSTEDPLLRMHAEGKLDAANSLSEAAAMIVLGRGNSRRHWPSSLDTHGPPIHGISTPLIRFVKGSKHV